MRRRGNKKSEPARKAVDQTKQDETAESIPAPVQPRMITARPNNSSQIFMLIFGIRFFGAMSNLIYDCDEVFNFFEPLHYLVSGFGFQTWEHSSEFALRSYLYLAAHYLIAKPLSLLAHSRALQRVAFFGLRVALGAASALVETELYQAVIEFNMIAAASYLTIFLVLSTGMFCAATAFLPSTLAMCCLTYCAAHVLRASCAPSPQAKLRAIGRVIGGACVAVLFAWPVSGVAFLPFAVWVLYTAPWPWAFGTLLSTAGLILIPSYFLDQYFYGRNTLAIYNFVKYNVLGGGESHLYGVEKPEYYIISGLLNFNGIWVLALIFPFFALTELAIQLLQTPPTGLHSVDAPAPAPSGLTYYAAKLMTLALVLSPVYLWAGVLSAMPHKEERFLYVVYPLICLAGAVTLQMVETFFRAVLRVPKSAVNRLVTAGLTAITILSTSRTFGVLTHYGAPMRIWDSLPTDPGPVLAKQSAYFAPEISVVCVGGEWHRFPSSFFLPSDRYRVGFLKTSFDGMLPTYFSEDGWPLGGTRSAPDHLNDRNKEHPRQYIEGIDHCSFVVQLEPGEDLNWAGRANAEWTLLRSVKFLNASASPLVSRVLFIPGAMGEGQNVYSKYRLYQRVAAPSLLLQ